MKRVAITTLGCKINQFESAAMAETLGKDGFLMVPFEDEADFYVINTCTVTAKTDAESRKLIRRAGRRNPDARIVVTGCYAQVAFEELREMPGVDLILGNVEKKGITGLLREIDAGPRVLVSDIALEKEAETLALESFAEHTRAFLQVQNGCDAYCSYCIVPYARGRSRSVPFADVLAGITAFAEKGFKEVVLTGIHLGGYGLDLVPATNLHALLVAADRQHAVPRLRIGSVEPTEISSDFISFLAGAETVCHHLHIPLQSGSDPVLGRMNRKYTTDRFREVVENLVTFLPDIAIGCDIIAGFPGETDEEFSRGLGFVESLPIAYLHVFPYSPRSGTPAAAMADQVKHGVIRERAQSLRRLSDQKKRAFYQRFTGRNLPVLIQQRDADGSLKGLSRNYIPVTLSGDDALHNREVMVRVTEVARESVRGECIP
jgi:threonylcarbamoyladenosine tRNA methylthiotransferase MtaB